MRNQIDTNSLGFLINDVARLLRAEMDRRITNAGLGVTAGEARALVHAARAGLVRQTILAEKMSVEAMTLSGYLDRLEAHGLVTRAPDPADRRAKLVQLTERADDVLSELVRISADVRSEAAGNLKGAEWAALLESLKTVRANLCEMRNAPDTRETDTGDNGA